MKAILPLLITLLMVHPDTWKILWTPHPENKGIRIVYQCDTGVRFFALNWFDITPDQDEGTFHRVEIPEGSTSCWYGAELVRGDPFSPEHDYTAEYTLGRIE